MTIEDGFCDESITGLATAAFGLFTFKDDIELGYQIAKVCDTLIEESPNKHALRSRLCRELDSTLKGLVEPQQAVVPRLHDSYNSAMLAGDVETAMSCLSAFCTGSMYTGEELSSVCRKFKGCIEQAVSREILGSRLKVKLILTLFHSFIHSFTLLCVEKVQARRRASRMHGELPPCNSYDRAPK